MKTSKRTLLTAIFVAICSTILSCASTDKSASAGIKSCPEKHEKCLKLDQSLFFYREYRGEYKKILSNISDSVWENAAEFANDCKCWMESMRSSIFSSDYSIRESIYNNRKRLVDSLQKPLEEWQAKKEFVNEINALIENNNEEINIVLSKCNEYQSKYGEIHKTCGHIQDSIQKSIRISMNYTQDSTIYEQAKPEIIELLKTNKLEDCFNKCKQVGRQFKTDKFKNDEELISLCGEQLNAKIKKLPLKQINSVEFAKIYYQGTGYEHIAAKMFHNFGKIVLAETIGYNKTISIEISGSILCDFKQSDYIVGYGKYIGMKSLTVYGSVPHYQLLWCEN